MAEPPPPSDLSFSDLSSEFDNLPVPSMDPLFFSANNGAMPCEAFASDLDFAMELGDNGDFEITFDDLDDLYMPHETDEFLLPDVCVPPPASPPVEFNGDDKHSSYNSTNPESLRSYTASGLVDQNSDVARFLNSQSSESGSCKQELSVTHSLDNSGDQNSHHSADVKDSTFQSTESDHDRESSGGPVSSQGSGNGVSGDSCVYEVMNSPDSDRDDRDISSRGIADQNIKLEEMGKSCDLKRKKQYNEGNTEVRTTKYRKSSIPMENTSQQSGLDAMDEEDEKRKARLMRNRESAQLSRQRKKHYVEELEEKVRSMHSTIADLSSKVSFIMAENATLRQQLSAGGGGMCPPPAPGMYPHPPMPPMTYPWMPYAPYVVKPQGSQVPLVPIPRLKSQQPQSAPKTKKTERKTESKTKKVASISFLGLFFFIFLFGGLLPLVNVKFGDLGDNVPSRSVYVTDRFYGQHGGKIWQVVGHRNNGSKGDPGVGLSFGISDKTIYEKGRKLGEETHEQRDSSHRTGSDEYIKRGNASEHEPLVASLYVPRNDKLVKIDGNLIIHSVLATEKAMASQTAHTKKNSRETGLAVSNDWDSALAIPEVGRNRGLHPHIYKNPPEQQKALASGSAETLKDHIKSTATDGRMQQWFREGLAGPMLSSGLCTEVFQFDASPKPGAIVPASSVANVSTENRQNETSVNSSRNRRFLRRLPDSRAKSGLNISEEHVVGNQQQNEELHGNKSMSSMVVSVLVDPKEVGDGDVDGMMKPKPLSRIFVVVLIDSVKYVTYSCGLPRASPHLVTA